MNCLGWFGNFGGLGFRGLMRAWGWISPDPVSRREVFYKKVIPNFFSEFTGIRLRRSLFLNIENWRSTALLKRFIDLGVFLWIPFFTEHQQGSCFWWWSSIIKTNKMHQWNKFTSLKNRELNWIEVTNYAHMTSRIPLERLMFCNVTFFLPASLQKACFD